MHIKYMQLFLEPYAGKHYTAMDSTSLHACGDVSARPSPIPVGACELMGCALMLHMVGPKYSLIGLLSAHT